jgi:CheY-like chemotaxis protein
VKTIVASHNPDLARDFDRDLLKRDDLKLVPARNSTELIARLRAGADLCFLDRVLPDGDGLGVLEQIRADRSLDPLPVVLVTTMGAPHGDPENARQAGFADVVELPAPPGALSLMVGRLLGVPLRRDERFAVRVHVFDAAPPSDSAGAASNAPAYLGTSVDLSEAGMLVKSLRPVEVGTLLQIRFALPGRPEELTLRGKVVRVDLRSFEPQRGLAVAFVDPSAAERAALRDYLKVLTGGRPFMWQLSRPDADDVRQAVTLSGVIASADDLKPLAVLRGEIDYRMRDLQRLGADGVQVWLEYVRHVAAPAGPQRVRLLECPVWFVQQAGIIPNLTEGQELVSLYAPYGCDACGIDEDRLLDVARDLEGGRRRHAPELRCTLCQQPVQLSEPADSYFALFR